MKINPVLLFSIAIISMSAVQSCARSHAKPRAVRRPGIDVITVETHEVPPDMRTEDFILIGVLKGRNSYDKYLIKNFNLYTGKYYLATKEELKTRYQDTDKYRYVMDYNVESSMHAGNERSIGYRYYILDRKTNIIYTRKSRSGFFSKEINVYVTAVENTRKK